MYYFSIDTSPPLPPSTSLRIGLAISHFTPPHQLPNYRTLRPSQSSVQMKAWRENIPGPPQSNSSHHVILRLLVCIFYGPNSTPLAFNANLWPSRVLLSFWWMSGRPASLIRFAVRLSESHLAPISSNWRDERASYTNDLPKTSGSIGTSTPSRKVSTCSTRVWLFALIEGPMLIEPGCSQKHEPLACAFDRRLGLLCSPILLPYRQLDHGPACITSATSCYPHCL